MPPPTPDFAAMLDTHDAIYRSAEGAGDVARALVLARAAVHLLNAPADPAAAPVTYGAHTLAGWGERVDRCQHRLHASSIRPPHPPAHGAATHAELVEAEMRLVGYWGQLKEAMRAVSTAMMAGVAGDPDGYAFPDLTAPAARMDGGRNEVLALQAALAAQAAPVAEDPAWLAAQQAADPDRAGLLLLPVTSSNLAAVGYAAATQTLTVQFKSGGTYDYAGVSPTEYGALLLAPSLGTFLNQQIKPAHPATKRTDPVPQVGA